MVLLWSIWQQRNDKVWRDKVEPFQHVRAINLLTDWKGAQNHKNLHSQQRQYNTAIRWSKPPTGRYKCNIDASFSKQHNKVGIGICIRDDQGRFVLAKTEWLSPITDVDIGEALGLLSALNWVHELQLENVDFELDSKNVVTSFHSKLLTRLSSEILLRIAYVSITLILETLISSLLGDKPMRLLMP
ncbi:cytochrome p450 [Trifolium pratense]|uniref:Cytochrome p450 n=1 Tax=Trifolium pratense TaxID=57577 RepID=A0A2K3NLD1_TRIPR|nr:cytochrome p450 [Trifolium pratense]